MLPHPWDSSGKNTGVGCHFLLQCMEVKSQSEVAQLCPTLCDPIDCSLLGSSIHGILQARILEWLAISFSNAWKWKVKVKLLSHVRLLATPWTVASEAPPSTGFPRQAYWSGVPLPSSWETEQVLIFFFWGIVDLQCCANLCCIAKWLSYIHIFFFNIIFHYGLRQDIWYSLLCYTIG